MSTSSIEILDLSRSLIAQKEEVSFRAAASRAYYAAFHACKPIADKLPISSANGGVHNRLIASLADAPDQSLRKAAARLKMAKDTRVTADYHLGEDFTELDAISAIRKAEDILRLIEIATKR